MPLVWTILILLVVIGLSLTLACLSFRYWLFLLVICVPFDISVSNAHLPRLSVMDYVIASCALALIWRSRISGSEFIFKTLRRPEFRIWFVFLLYAACLSWLFDGSLKEVVRWGEFIFVYFLSWITVDEDFSGLSHTIAQLLCLFGALMAAWGLFQYFITHGDYYQTFAIFRQHNAFSAFLSFTLPAATALAWQYRKGHAAYLWLSLGSFLTITLAVGLAYSRGSWLGLMIGTITIAALFLYRRPINILVRGLGISFIIVTLLPVGWVIYRHHQHKNTLLSSVSTSDSSRIFEMSARTYYWTAATDVLIARPYTGIGPGHYPGGMRPYLSTVVGEYYDLEQKYSAKANIWQHLHNAYLQFLVTYGLLGVILISFGLAFICRSFFSPISMDPIHVAYCVSGVAFLVHNLVDYLFVNSFDLLFAILAVLCSKALLEKHS